MKQSIRRLLCLGLIFALALSLAACGQTETKSPDSTADPPAQAEGTAATAQQTAQTETVGQAEATEPTAEDGSVYNGLFETDRVHTVDVTISEEDWADLRQNPLSKTKYRTDVVIDGETVEQVSFATKGNTSLSFVASNPDNDRYSFKLNFGKYNKGQTYHGLNKLSLNNLYADATYLKDYLSYLLFRRAGVEAPLTSFVWLTVNGADHGLYIAIEDVSEAWMARTNEGEGVVYKPETEQLDQAGKHGQNGQPPIPPDGGGNGQFSTPPDGSSGATPSNGAGNGQAPAPPDGDSNGQNPTPPDGAGNGQMPAPPSGENNGQMPTPPDGNGQSGFPGGRGGFPGGPAGPGGSGENSKGADLAYNGDALDNYSDIFDNAETDADETDQQRVVAALKALSEGTSLEQHLNTDEIIRYFAVHNFVLNYDSYTGNMLHNYFLYEKDGKLEMLPWDYNLAFGAFGGGGPGGQGRPDEFGRPDETGKGGEADPSGRPDGTEGPMATSDATALINTGIDSPLNGPTEAQRPMWAWIAADEAYLTQYHQIFDQLLRDYFENGTFEAELDSLSALLRPYVEKDPTAFYTVEEFDKAVEALRQVCLLRAQSVRAQLDGALATKTTEQNAADRVDASGVNVSDMGTHMGGGEGGFPGGRGGKRR